MSSALTDVLAKFAAGKTVKVRAKKADGAVTEFDAVLRIDTPQEVLYYQHGGILQYVLRRCRASRRAKRSGSSGVSVIRRGALGRPRFSSADYYAAFLRGTLAPDLRASLMPIAIACLRLFTLRLPPDFNLPCLYSCITLPTLFCALLLYLRCPPELLLDDDERERLDFFFAEVDRDVPRCEVLLRLPVLRGCHCSCPV